MATLRQNQTLYYIDDGCKKARTEGYTGPCLECPFVKCFEDEDFDWKRYQHEKRNVAIRDLRDSGIPVYKIMRQYHLSFYTVEKICNVT